MIDLGPYMGSSNAGVHAASFGGVWQCAIYGFGGLRMLDGKLRICPRLPRGWDRLDYTVNWRGQKLYVAVTKKHISIQNLTGTASVEIEVNGEACIMERNDPLLFKDWLESQNILNVDSKPEWTLGTIKGILTNEKYCGDALLQKTFIQDCISKKVIRNTGQLPQYLIQNCHQGIVSRQTYDSVQAEMARRNAGKSPSRKNAPTGRTSCPFKSARLLYLIPTMKLSRTNCTVRSTFSFVWPR